MCDKKHFHRVCIRTEWKKKKYIIKCRHTQTEACGSAVSENQTISEKINKRQFKNKDKSHLFLVFVVVVVVDEQRQRQLCRRCSLLLLAFVSISDWIYTHYQWFHVFAWANKPNDNIELSSNHRRFPCTNCISVSISMCLCMWIWVASKLARPTAICCVIIMHCSFQAYIHIVVVHCVYDV